MTEQRLTDEQRAELADMLPKVGEPEAEWTMIRTSIARAILSADRGEPVAEVISDGATVRLGWASVQAAHNATLGYLYADRWGPADPEDHWPCAKLVVVNDKIASATMYAPGLPDGTHDVWCVPVAAAPSTPQPDTVQVPKFVAVPSVSGNIYGPNQCPDCGLYRGQTCSRQPCRYGKESKE